MSKDMSRNVLSVRLTSKPANRRYLSSRLGSGALPSHEMVRLVLLCSHPDTVHEVSLRKTGMSTLLKKGGSIHVIPRIGITPAIADFRYRAPLLPRLHGPLV